jgi:hypothetical protein
MGQLRSEHQVKTVMRSVFAAAAALEDPTIIVDTSRLYDPPPPQDDLGFPPPPAATMGALLTLVSRELLGTKVTTNSVASIIPPDLQILTTFGSLAIAMHHRINRIADRAVFHAVCAALKRDPAKVPQSMPITHPTEAGARAFARRLAREVAFRICDTAEFRFTNSEEQKVMVDTTVSELVDLVVTILAEREDCI